MKEKKTINIKLDKELLKKATEKLEKKGLNVNLIIERFLDEIIICNGLPFEIKNE